MSRHAFVSYCRADRELVRSLRNDLVGRGLKVWWDEEILPGQDWPYEIRRAMAAAYAVVVCLSKNLNDRERSGVYPELRDAIAELRNRPPGDVFVIPVRLSESEIPDIEIDAMRTLRSLQCVDLFPDSSWEAGLARLATVLRMKSDAHEMQPTAGVGKSDEPAASRGSERTVAAGGGKPAETRRKPAFNFFLKIFRLRISIMVMSFLVVSTVGWVYWSQHPPVGTFPPSTAAPPHPEGAGSTGSSSGTSSTGLPMPAPPAKGQSNPAAELTEGSWRIRYEASAEGPHFGMSLHFRPDHTILSEPQGGTGASVQGKWTLSGDELRLVDPQSREDVILTRQPDSSYLGRSGGGTVRLARR